MSVQGLTALIIAIAALLGHLPAVIALFRRTSSAAAATPPAGTHRASSTPPNELP